LASQAQFVHFAPGNGQIAVICAIVYMLDITAYFFLQLRTKKFGLDQSLFKGMNSFFCHGSVAQNIFLMLASSDHQPTDFSAASFQSNQKLRPN
jgi:hypothetical protein